MTEAKQRDFYIDTVRGLCVFAIIFVHTVFFSGEDYLPNFVRNIALFFDIPAFFFLTGCTISVHKSVNPVKQMAKLLIVFFIVFFVLHLFSGSYYSKVILPLLLHEINLNLFPVFSDAYWFVPVYIVGLLYAVIVINYLKRYFLLFLLLIVPVIYIVSWFYTYPFGYEVLGLKFQQVLFYFWLILLGFHLYNKDSKQRLLFGIFLVLSAVIGSVYLDVFSLKLQLYKFPVVKLPYFVISMFSVGLILIFVREVKENFVSKIGENAIYYYASQGISSSLIFLLAKHISCNIWCKLFVCYVLNCVTALILGYIIFKLFKTFGNYLVAEDKRLF
ncbi:MAG: acyltransferase [Candidatus Gastranaerophilales bacterium]|nr:acyltransferase [Candidatus Gastranaerophilales bacterium]